MTDPKHVHTWLPRINEFAASLVATRIHAGECVAGETTLIDRLSCGFTSHSTQNRVISETFPQLSQSLGLMWKKLNLTQQTARIHQSKQMCRPTSRRLLYTAQNKHKTKARLSRLLRNPHWKRSGSLLEENDKQGRRWVRKK